MSNYKGNYNRWFISFILFICLTTVITVSYKPQNKNLQKNNSYNQKAPEHWSKNTETEKKPSAKPSVIGKDNKNEINIIREKEIKPTDSHLNKKTNNINVIYFWTDKDKLKVVTLMTINQENNKAGILAIPVFTKVKEKETDITIGDIYSKGGKLKVIKTLENYLEIEIDNFVSIDQVALEKLSNIIGDFEVNGEKINMADAFEQTLLNQRNDDQEVLRSLGNYMMKPVNLLKIPSLFWFATANIDSNMIGKNFWHFVKIYKKIDYPSIRKVALYGKDIIDNGTKIRVVEEKVWHNIIFELSA